MFGEEELEGLRPATVCVFCFKRVRRMKKPKGEAG